MAENVVTADDDVGDNSRRKFLLGATVAMGAVGAAFVVAPFVASWKPSERARALGAPSELDVSKIEPGQMTTITWRKQPIYVVRRTPEMVSSLSKNDPRLKDPKSESSDQPEYAKNEMRSRKSDILVLIGTCTHLGCLPKSRFEAGVPELGADWPGGFFCPCHGSRFDLAGRVFNGSPASLNLRIPPYDFSNDHTLVIGLDSAATKSGAA
jgi:ubiquinol-cytochrome c reductase iron-sulfur subunit